MHQCLNDIMHCPFKGGLKLMFLHSKCIELLALQAQSHEVLATSPSLTCKSTYDQECIHYAREYLLQHADNPPSLAELARIVGLNEFKLKKGFKEIYQHTLFGYLNDYRLNKAKQILLHKTQPIKEIADNFGYSSVQHFTKAFKKKFGIPPGSVK
jgi:AraC-like DNA-binding protein